MEKSPSGPPMEKILPTPMTVSSVVTEQKQILWWCSTSGGAWDFFEDKSGACFRKRCEPLVYILA